MSLPRTENGMKRHRAYRWAYNQALTVLRERHREDHRDYARLLAIMRPELTSGARFNAADRDLRREHEEEFAVILRPLYEQRLRDIGYAPAPRGGFATGRYARKRTTPH